MHSQGWSAATTLGRKEIFETLKGFVATEPFQGLSECRNAFPGLELRSKPFYEAGSCQEEFRELIGSPFYSSFHSWLAT